MRHIALYVLAITIFLIIWFWRDDLTLKYKWHYPVVSGIFVSTVIEIIGWCIYFIIVG